MKARSLHPRFIAVSSALHGPDRPRFRIVHSRCGHTTGDTMKSMTRVIRRGLASLAVVRSRGDACGMRRRRGSGDVDHVGGRQRRTDRERKRSDLPQGSEPVELDPAEFTTEIDNPYWPMSVGQPLGLPRDRHRGHRRAGRGRGHRRDEDDRQRRRGPGRPRHGHRERRAGRGHRRLVRPGRRRQHLVPGREHRGVRERQDRQPRGLVRGRRRRRAGRDRDARRSPSPGWPTARSTSRARPRTRAP